MELPDLGVAAIKAKVDTGARTSALHAFNVREFNRDGKTFVRFQIHPIQRSAKQTVFAEAEVVDVRNVKSSGGHVTRRLVIATRVQLAGHCWRVELTLASRDTMGFRMLLGRQALRRRFVVDAGKAFVADRQNKVRKKRTKPPNETGHSGGASI